MSRFSDQRTRNNSRALVTLAVILFAGISDWHCIVYGARYGCPARSLIKPCTCTDKNKGLDISCEGASVEMMREAFENIAQSGQTATYLKLTRNHMETFPSNLLQPLDVTHLTALYSNISVIDEYAFAGLEEKLESLDLSQNSLAHVSIQFTHKSHCVSSV